MTGRKPVVRKELVDKKYEDKQREEGERKWTQMNGRFIPIPPYLWPLKMLDTREIHMEMK